MDSCKGQACSCKVAHRLPWCTKVVSRDQRVPFTLQKAPKEAHLEHKGPSKGLKDAQQARQDSPKGAPEHQVGANLAQLGANLGPT